MNDRYSLLIALAVVISAAVPDRAIAAAKEIPARFDADRVYVDLRLASGGQVELYSDTGGGGLVLSASAADRHHVSTAEAPPDLQKELGENSKVGNAPLLVSELPPLPKQAIIVPTARQIAGWPEQAEGFVGAPWFGMRAWTWDYPHRRFVLRQPGWTARRGSNEVQLHFQVDGSGARTTNFPRIETRIDGQLISMLLHTGAETFLTPEALAKLRDNKPAFRATSMVRAGIFDRWHSEHPDWPYIADAQEVTHAPMIRVPSVEVGGLRTPPVWFTRRPDANFQKFMSSMTDAPVDGSIGGNVFATFCMTLDYQHAKALFGRPRSRNDCFNEQTSAAKGSTRTRPAAFLAANKPHPPS